MNIELTLLVLHSFFSGVLKTGCSIQLAFDLYQNAPELVDSIMRTLHPPVPSLPMGIEWHHHFSASLLIISVNRLGADGFPEQIAL